MAGFYRDEDSRFAQSARISHNARGFKMLDLLASHRIRNNVAGFQQLIRETLPQ